MNIVNKLHSILTDTIVYNELSNIDTIKNFYNIKNLIIELNFVNKKAYSVTDKLILKKFFETHEKELLLLEKKQELAKDLLLRFISALSSLHQIKKIDFIDVETASENDIFNKTISLLPKTDIELQVFLDTGKL